MKQAHPNDADNSREFPFEVVINAASQRTLEPTAMSTSSSLQCRVLERPELAYITVPVDTRKIHLDFQMV